MPRFNQYDLVIFDCDGVIFDSNHLKLDAMKQALRAESATEAQVVACEAYFAMHFGRSRYYLIEHFVTDILGIPAAQQAAAQQRLLDDYGARCRQLYLDAKTTPHLLDLLTCCPADKYVASGSAQGELRDVMVDRGLSDFFRAVYGSPRPKNELVRDIVQANPDARVVMIGDAISDHEAARHAGIDFIFYRPFSTVEDKMQLLCAASRSRVITSYSELIQEL